MPDDHRTSLDSAHRDLHKACEVNRVSVVQHARAAGAHVPAQRYRHLIATAMDNARICGGSRPDAKHSSSSSPGTPASAKRAQLSRHSSALLARWAGPMSTAVTARPGAPFAQMVSLLQRAPLSRRIPAPKGAITCSLAQRKKFLSSPSRGSIQGKGCSK